MATFFKNSVEKAVGTDPVTMVTVGDTSSVTCVGLSLSNLVDGVVFVSLKVVGDSSEQVWVLKDIPLTSNTTLKAINGGEKLVLEAGDELILSTNTENSVDAVLSYVEIV